jgi:hypothetical protein
MCPQAKKKMASNVGVLASFNFMNQREGKK